MWPGASSPTLPARFPLNNQATRTGITVRYDPENPDVSVFGKRNDFRAGGYVGCALVVRAGGWRKSQPPLRDSRRFFLRSQDFVLRRCASRALKPDLRFGGVPFGTSRWEAG